MAGKDIEHLESESERHRENIHELRDIIQNHDLKHLLAEKELEKELEVIKTQFHLLNAMWSGVGALVGSIVSGVVVWAIVHVK